MLEYFINLGTDLIKDLIRENIETDEKRRKELLDAVKLLERATIHTKIIIHDNGIHRYGYSQRQMHLYDMWIEVAYSFMDINRNFAFSIRDKANYWSNPEGFQHNNHLPEIHELEDSIRQFLEKYYPTPT